MQVGRYIQHKGGVVTAEELAPFLDAPRPRSNADSADIDESFVVPALVRFGGSPEVDEAGNLIYRFPDLQKTGRAQVGLDRRHMLVCSVSGSANLQRMAPMEADMCQLVTEGRHCGTHFCQSMDTGQYKCSVCHEYLRQTAFAQASFDPYGECMTL